MSKSSFARQQLLKHGWTDGSGLGKDETGITEAIKVKIKNNKTGVGHDPGKEFTHHWWDHAFNQAASSIQVVSTEEGITVEKQVVKSEKDKKAEAARKKAALYGNFVKGATLKNSEGRQIEEKDGGSSSESEDEAKGQSQTSLTEEEIFEKCGGRTAHKGARHGHKMNGKLQRIQEQEDKLLQQMIDAANQKPCNKLSKKPTNGKGDEASMLTNQNGCYSSVVEENGIEEQEEYGVKKKRKKKKKDKHKEREEDKGSICDNVEKKLTVLVQDEDCVNDESSDHRKKKKQKKRKSDCDVEDVARVTESCDKGAHECDDIGVHTDAVSGESGKKKRKKSKKRKETEDEETEEEVVEKKKKKKKDKH